VSAFQTNTVILAATLTVSGNKAIYEIDEHKLASRAYPGQSQNSRLIELGKLLAVKNGGIWFNKRDGRASWSERITDRKTLALLESYPLASLEQ